MEPIKSFTSTVVLLPIENIDTDQIIPARFLKVTNKAGLGDALFSDWRYNEDGSPKQDFILNFPESKGAQVLFAGDNFGCGSSREHAPQSLRKYGFNGVIAESFAEIFFGNSTGLAMPCVVASAADIKTLRDAIEADPQLSVTIDVVNQKVTTSSGLSFPATMPESSREALVSGRWDPIQELLDNDAADRIGDVVSVHVIPRPHANVDAVLPLGRAGSGNGNTK